MTRLVQTLVTAALWICDRIAGPLPETDADRVRDREEADYSLLFNRALLPG